MTDSKRTDHAAEARRKMRVTAELLSAGGDELFALGNTLEAQVHATLALVEQQRIANLIAAAALNVRDVDLTKPWEADDDTPEWRAVRDQVAEGLGL